jgi:hypothetical protein
MNLIGYLLILNIIRHISHHTEDALGRLGDHGRARASASPTTTHKITNMTQQTFLSIVDVQGGACQERASCSGPSAVA